MQCVFTVVLQRVGCGFYGLIHIAIHSVHGALQRLMQSITPCHKAHGKFLELHPNAFKPYPFCASLAVKWLQNFIAKPSILISAYNKAIGFDGTMPTFWKR